MSGEAHKEVDRLLAGLEHLDETVRIESLQKLVSAPGAPLLRVLRKTARFDASPTVRAEAVRLLVEVAERLSGTDLSGSGTGADDSTRRLVLLNDPDSKVRAQAVAALTMSFDARVPEILMTALEREKDPGVLETLIQALASEGASVAPKLIVFLAHEDARVRAAAVEVLGDTKDDSALTHLVPLLEDKHERVRVAAVRALRSARQEAVLACVDEMLKRTGERDVRAALYVLRYFASAISVPRLAPRLTGTPPSVAAMARASIASLAKKGSKRAKRALERVG
ncbi:MAG: HEAT repeat domain-containing protein, partial [Chloroflexota bacterium]